MSDQTEQKTDETQRDVNLLEMPLEGIAAYWLSLRKVMGPKLQPKTLEEEVVNTQEPFIKYLLEMFSSGVTDAELRRLCQVRQDTAVRELRLKLAMMREALTVIASAENPRKALMRMGAYLAEPSLTEESATKMALDMVRMAEKSKDGYVVTVEPSLSPEQLLVKLLFYVLWARREGKAGLEPFAENGRCRFFNQGLGMVVDGFERSFVRGCLDIAEAEILDTASRKMALSVDMVLALRAKLSYEDMFRAVRAYLP
ncbi:hypothetical protein [Desulfocurvus sp. DL9XJH121]